jgi:hypothetical protein
MALLYILKCSLRFERDIMVEEGKTATSASNIFPRQ